MSDYVTLLGAEQVEKAGYVMRDAAHSMQLAVSSLDGVLEQQHRFMDDWLQRFEAMLATASAKEEKA